MRDIVEGIVTESIIGAISAENVTCRCRVTGDDKNIDCTSCSAASAHDLIFRGSFCINNWVNEINIVSWITSWEHSHRLIRNNHSNTYQSSLPFISLSIVFPFIQFVHFTCWSMEETIKLSTQIGLKASLDKKLEASLFPKTFPEPFPRLTVKCGASRKSGRHPDWRSISIFNCQQSEWVA